MKDSIKFERLTAEIFSLLRNNHSYETVEHDVQLEGQDGLRQIDVLIRGKVGPIDILTIVECKDHNKNICVTHVDALDSKMQDVNAQQAVLVSRKGFSKTAIRKAKRVGIALSTVHQARIEKWEIKLELPVVVEEIVPVINPKFILSPDKPGSLFFSMIINGVNIFDEFTESWNKGLIRVDTHVWFPKSISKPYFMHNDEGDAIPITDMSFQLKFEHNYYFGYINELESTKVIDFIMKEEAKILFEVSDLLNYKENFARYDTIDTLPKTTASLLKVGYLPKIEKTRSGRVMIERIA